MAKQLSLLQHNLLLAARAQDWQQLRGLDRQLLALVQQLEQAGAKEQFASQLNALRRERRRVGEGHQMFVRNIRALGRRGLLRTWASTGTATAAAKQATS